MIDQRIRTHIDAIAPPIRFDEITKPTVSSPDHEPRRHYRLLVWAAAVVIVIGGIAALGVIRSPSDRAIPTDSPASTEPLYLLPEDASVLAVRNGSESDGQPSAPRVRVAVAGIPAGDGYRDIVNVAVTESRPDFGGSWEALENSDREIETSSVRFMAAATERRGGRWVTAQAAAGESQLAVDLVREVDVDADWNVSFDDGAYVVIEQSDNSFGPSTYFEASSPGAATEFVVVETMSIPGVLRGATPGDDVAPIDIQGQAGWHISRTDADGPWNAIVWSPVDGIVAAVSAHTELSNLLDVGESLSPVDQPTWRAATMNPIDFSTTSSPLPLWPSGLASDPPATTTGYGMSKCDGGYGTKVLRVDAADSPSHAYSGTLCVFIKLAAARADAVTTCATLSDGVHYARCQRQVAGPDATDVNRAVDAAATDSQQAEMTSFPDATAWDQPELFDVMISAADPTRSGVDFDESGIAVTIDPVLGINESGVDEPGACFTIDLSDATATGCVGRSLLATGLAYGAFQDNDGPVRIVGIVPDEVTAIIIDGTSVTPTNNIWQYTTTTGHDPQITVQSADGRTATTS